MAWKLNKHFYYLKQTKLLYENDKNEKQQYDSFVSRLKAIRDGIIVMSFLKQRLNTW